MLWGADLSRLTSTYRECLELFQEALDFLSEEDREWILGKALAEVLNWPETARSFNRHSPLSEINRATMSHLFHFVWPIKLESVKPEPYHL